MRVLIVDDEDIALVLLENTLTREHPEAVFLKMAMGQQLSSETEHGTRDTKSVATLA